MQKWSIFSIVLIIQILLVFYFKDAVFFWDTVQFAGMHGSYFFENGFSLFLPQEMDSGHPPLFGNFLALSWKLFGKSLQVSHFVMLPFLILNLFLALKIGEYFSPKRSWLFMVLMFVCPYYLGHSILVSPDIILISAFLLCLYAIVEEEASYAYIGATLLCLISMRGCMLAAGFLLFIIIRNRKDLKSQLRLMLPFVLGLGLFVLYQIAHYLYADWIGFHADSPWNESFSIIDLKGFVFNSILFLWRCLDYGLVLLLILLSIAVYNGYRPNRNLVFLFLIIGIIFFVVTVPFSGLMNHRYFLPMILLFLLLCSQIDWLQKNWLTALVVLLLFAGNFLIYPKHIAQGWDSTLAHAPFYTLESQMQSYIVEEGLDPETIGTAFPLKKHRKFIDLKESNMKYQDYDLNAHTYILYSTIMNSFSDEELENLFKYWTKKKRFSAAGIEMILFEKK